MGDGDDGVGCLALTVRVGDCVQIDVPQWGAVEIHLTGTRPRWARIARHMVHGGERLISDQDMKEGSPLIVRDLPAGDIEIVCSRIANQKVTLRITAPRLYIVTRARKPQEI